MKNKLSTELFHSINTVDLTYLLRN